MSDCPHCSALTEVIATSEAANAEQRDQIIALNVALGAAERRESAARGQITKQRNAEILSRDVTAILRLWRALLAPKASIDLEGTRADIVRKALKTLTKGTSKERRRICMDAVRGLALRPYTGPHGRTANSIGTVRRHEIRYALMDEEHIEEHAGFYRAAQEKPLEWLNRAMTAATDVEAHWRWLYFQAWRKDCAAQRRAEAVARMPERPHLFLIASDREAA